MKETLEAIGEHYIAFLLLVMGIIGIVESVKDSFKRDKK